MDKLHALRTLLAKTTGLPEVEIIEAVYLGGNMRLDNVGLREILSTQR